MKLYSWNVNGIRAVLKKEALQKFLETEKPDILCLQEIKARPEQVNYDFKDYKILWNPAKRPGYSGTAMLFSKQYARFTNLETAFLVNAEKNIREESAFSTNSLETSPLANTSEVNEVAISEGRILVADCEKFFLVNVYTPNSKPDLSRLKLRENTWDPEFLTLLKTLEKDKPVVVCGDFNAAHTEIDLARPKTNHHSAGFTDAERKGITNLIENGFIDTFRVLNPDVERYTWWSHWGHARENNVGWRIDYFFISQSLRPNLKDAEIYENITGSDHCPVSITLEF